MFHFCGEYLNFATLSVGKKTEYSCFDKTT